VAAALDTPGSTPALFMRIKSAGVLPGTCGGRCVDIFWKERGEALTTGSAGPQQRD